MFAKTGAAAMEQKCLYLAAGMLARLAEAAAAEERTVTMQLLRAWVCMPCSAHGHAASVQAVC